MKHHKIIIASVLFITVIVSLYLRIGIPFDRVFVDDTVIFTDPDSYYHMHMADYSTENFPDVITYDKDLGYPDGHKPGMRPVMGWIIALVSIIISLGHTSKEVVNTVGAVLPALFGTALIAPIYIISRETINKWAGLIAIAVFVCLPGEILGRTTLGFADHHALETLLAALTIMFIVLSFKNKWHVIGSSICLSIYSLNWYGAPILIIIILVYYVIQSIINHLKQEQDNALTIAVLVPFAVNEAVFVLLQSSETIHNIVFCIAIIAVVLLATTSYYMSKYKLNRWLYLAAIVSIVFIGVLLIFTAIPSIGHGITKGLGYLTGRFFSAWTGQEITIQEVQPLFMPYGKFTFIMAWGQFSTAGIAAFIGFVILVAKRGIPNKYEMLLIIWTIVNAILVILQRRFGYYFGINVAILAGYSGYLAVKYFSRRYRSNRQAKKLKASTEYQSTYHMSIAILIIAVMLLLPNFVASKHMQKARLYSMDSAWIQATDWLREQPADDYSVMSWWDYGYWILREGKKPVICHPGGGDIGTMAKILITQVDENYNFITANFEYYKTKYIVVDYRMVEDLFYAYSPCASRVDIKYDIKPGSEEHHRSFVWQLWAENVQGFNKVLEVRQAHTNEPKIKIFEFVSTN
jgi:dolichyl-diphosphooligosaccharide--protein glycosyltransferase